MRKQGLPQAIKKMKSYTDRRGLWGSEGREGGESFRGLRETNSDLCASAGWPD